MATLPTNFQDDVLNSAMNGKRRYSITEQSDGNYEITDQTTYDTEGSVFGAAFVNQICGAVNENTNALSGLSFRVVDALPGSPDPNTIYIVLEG